MKTVEGKEKNRQNGREERGTRKKRKNIKTNKGHEKKRMIGGHRTKKDCGREGGEERMGRRRVGVGRVKGSG